MKPVRHCCVSCPLQIEEGGELSDVSLVDGCFCRLDRLLLCTRCLFCQSPEVVLGFNLGFLVVLRQHFQQNHHHFSYLWVLRGSGWSSDCFLVEKKQWQSFFCSKYDTWNLLKFFLLHFLSGTHFDSFCMFWLKSVDNISFVFLLDFITSLKKVVFSWFEASHGCFSRLLD